MHFRKVSALILTILPFTILSTPLAFPDIVQPGSLTGNESVTPSDSTISLAPTGFIPNRGQFDEQVLFCARIREGSAFVLKTGDVVYQLVRSDEQRITDCVVIHESITGLMEHDEIKGAGETGVKLNYFKGNEADRWLRGLPCFTDIECGEVLPGIRLRLSMKDGRCEKVFTVAPGAKPETIQLSLGGVDQLGVMEDGRLECVSGQKNFCFSKPVAYQVIDGVRKDVEVGYVANQQQYRFVVGEYDSSSPLTIDPLLYSTYFGGTWSDKCNQQILSEDGTIYIIGETGSFDFPMVGDSYDPTFNGVENDYDVFISRLDANLTTLISSTYIGGNNDDLYGYQSGFVQGQDGNIHVAVTTRSPDFPVTEGVFDEAHNGEDDGAVFIMNPELSELIASTYLGSSADDSCGPLIVGPQGDIYVSGVTREDDFPTTKGAYTTTFNYTVEIYISRFNNDLTVLLASTFIGGDRYDRPRSLLLDESGDIFMVGVTASPDYPTTPGAYDETFNSVGAWPDYDVCVSRLDGDLSTLVASTFVGGENRDECEDALFDGDTVIFAGFSNSDDYPTTPGAISEERLGGRDIIASRLSKDLGTLMVSTYIGGAEPDWCYALDVDRHGFVFMTGQTGTDYPFPTTPGSFDPDVNDDREDAFILRIDEGFERLTAATILGGNDSALQQEKGQDIEITADGKVVVSGYTLAADFPTTPGVIFEEQIGTYDCFISVLDQLLTLHPGKVIVAPGQGSENPPSVRVYPAAQDAVYGFEFSAYGPPRFGANVCCGNLDADAADEILTGAGPGEIYGPHVRGFEIDGTPLPDLSFLAYGTHKYGVNVAAGDIDGDGFDEIITGAGPGAVFGPHVRAFDYDGTPGVTPVPGVSYFAYGTPKWGVNVAAGDIDGDGFDEIVTGAGPGAVYGPHVRGWDIDGDTAAAIPQVSFLAYGTNKFGVNVTTGDVDGDGIDEIVTGAGPGAVFGPHVRGWNYDGSSISSLPGYSFFAYQTGPLQFGVNVSSGSDVDGDGRDELVTSRGPHPEADTTVKMFTYDGSAVGVWFSLEAFPGLTHGVNVATGGF